jgi:hypothetical protein
MRYIKNIYNDHHYAKMLSHDSSAVIQFLHIAEEMNIPVDKVYVGLRLFYNKLKSCESIDNKALEYVFENVPLLLERFFLTESEDIKNSNYKSIVPSIEEFLLNKFTLEFDDFQKAPDFFIGLLAKDLVFFFKDDVYNIRTFSQEQEMFHARFRTMIIKFYEVLISKVLWAPQDGVAIWQSFIVIANHIQELAQYGIITHMDDLDDLFWSLIHRFCFCLDIIGSIIPLDFYTKVEESLAAEAVLFLEYPEQDPDIITKKDTLINALLQAKTKAVAYVQNGLLSAPMFEKTDN